MGPVTEYPDLEKVLRALPPAAHKELLGFVGYLRYKHKLEQAGPVVKLGGLWADVDLDVTDDDVRALREQVTAQLVNKI